MNKAEKTYFKEKFGKNLFQKKDVNMLLRKKYNKYYSLTNINSVNKINSEYIYDYEYQRYDSKLIYKDFEKNFIISKMFILRLYLLIVVCQRFFQYYIL